MSSGRFGDQRPELPQQAQARAIELIDLFLAAGADINAKITDDSSRTANVGRQPNAVTERKGQTALYGAVKNGWANVVEHLLAKGADPEDQRRARQDTRRRCARANRRPQQRRVRGSRRPAARRTRRADRRPLDHARSRPMVSAPRCRYHAALLIPREGRFMRATLRSSACARFREPRSRRRLPPHPSIRSSATPRSVTWQRTATPRARTRTGRSKSLGISTDLEARLERRARSARGPTT